MLCSACVSTSSVTKTLLTFSSRRSGWELSIFIYPFYVSGVLLVQLNSVVGVIGGHIRENHYIAYFETVLDLDRIDRSAAQGHLHLVCVFPVRFQLEKLYRAVLLTEHRALHEDHVVQTLQLDGSVHAKVGTGTGRQTLFAED